eukprot:Skav208959  [mRNA]  locus=scaffold1580:286172:287947:+ [translate_table: standard]
MIYFAYVFFVYSLNDPACSVSEASCTSQIRTARAVMEEMGVAAAAQGGVQAWAQIPLDHSERGVHKVVERQGTRLDLDLAYMEVDSEMIPWIDPRTWLQYVVDQGLCAMFAGVDPTEPYRAPMVWNQFWKNYKLLNPHHEIWDLDLDYSRTIGLYIHGDEGRTLKKSGLMVTSIQSCLGKGYDPKRLKTDSFGNIIPQVNFSGNTLTTRLVSFVVPKTLYDKKPDLYLKACEEFAKSLKSLLLDGVKDEQTNETYRFIVLGCKGDLPYLAKTGLLTRTFNTGAKRGSSKKHHGVCHLCLAGFPDFPAEDIASDKPAWLSTMGVKLPWDRTPPFLRHLHHDTFDAASFFCADLWHCIHLGVGRSWVASVINLLLSELPQSNLDLKWEFLTSHYHRWCRANKVQAHISKVTGYLMSYDDKTGKTGRWHKGSLTTNMCKWLCKLLSDVPSDQDGYLSMCKRATQQLNAMLKCFYEGDFFLSKQECLDSASLGSAFLRTYYFLAEKQYELNKPSMFPLYPKLHLLHHCVLRLASDGHRHACSQNPMATGCQMDEDCIGKLSRLSRRVCIRTTMERTMQRYMVACNTAWRDAGLLR